MTLRELIHSVDGELYADSPIYQQLLTVTPEYGSTKRIEVRLLNGEIIVTNVHLGSLGDILTYPIDVAPDLEITRYNCLMPYSRNCPLVVSVTQTNPTFGMK